MVKVEAERVQDFNTRRIFPNLGSRIPMLLIFGLFFKSMLGHPVEPPHTPSSSTYAVFGLFAVGYFIAGLFHYRLDRDGFHDLAWPLRRKHLPWSKISHIYNEGHTVVLSSIRDVIRIPKSIWLKVGPQVLSEIDVRNLQGELRPPVSKDRYPKTFHYRGEAVTNIVMVAAMCGLLLFDPGNNVTRAFLLTGWSIAAAIGLLIFVNVKLILTEDSVISQGIFRERKVIPYDAIEALAFEAPSDYVTGSWKLIGNQKSIFVGRFTSSRENVIEVIASRMPATASFVGRKPPTFSF